MSLSSYTVSAQIAVSDMVRAREFYEGSSASPQWGVPTTEPSATHQDPASASGSKPDVSVLHFSWRNGGHSRVRLGSTWFRYPSKSM